MFDATAVTCLRDPFPHVVVRDLFAPARARALAASFPTERFRHSQGRDGHYQLWDRSLVDEVDGLQPIDDLSPAWTRLIEELTSAAYRETVGQLLAVDVRGTQLKVRACCYPPGGWMLPHTDREDRVATQIIYLHPTWAADWGGALRILRSAAADDVVREIVPGYNSSVLLARSDRSFHAVTPVRADAPERRSLLVQLVRR